MEKVRQINRGCIREKEVSTVLFGKPEVGEPVALFGSPTARNSAFPEVTLCG